MPINYLNALAGREFNGLYADYLEAKANLLRASGDEEIEAALEVENAMVWRVIAMPSPETPHLVLKFNLFRDWIDDMGALDCRDGQGRALFESVRRDAIG